MGTLKGTFERYNQDCAAGKPDRFGKKFFKNWPYNIEDEYNVCEITPVIHYTMGGIKTNHLSEIEGPNGAIPGLYAAGEIMGGVHGKNRLGGNSLLDCVVYGRVAGREVMKYLKSGSASAGVLKKYSMEEVAKHNTRDDCWLVIHGKVYDVSKGFYDEHPGGEAALVVHAGKDATHGFDSMHTMDQLAEYEKMILIGELEGGASSHKTAKKFEL